MQILTLFHLRLHLTTYTLDAKGHSEERTIEKGKKPTIKLHNEVHNSDTQCGYSPV